MKFSVVIIAVFCAFGFTSALFAERQPFERYQSIIDRQMFGQPPAGFDPTKPPSEVQKTSSKGAAKELTKEQEKLKSAIHFSAINVTPSGETAVGFTDSSDKSNLRHYYLKVGETKDGWTVTEADPVKAKMTIVKDEISLELSLGDNSAQGGGNASRTTTAANQPDAARRPRLFGGARQGSASGGPAASLRERQQLRRERRTAEAEAMAKAVAEDRAKADAAAKEKEEETRLQREEDRAQLQQELNALKEEQRKIREEAEKAKTAAERKENEDNQE